MSDPLTPAMLQLRATLAMLAEQRDEARAEVEALRAQVAELLALGVSIHKATAAGIAFERAAVLRWLCRAAGNADAEAHVITHNEARQGLAGAVADAYAEAAIAIERGDHRGDE